MDNRDLYIRQAQLELTIPDSIAVIGCGGVGGNVAILSAMTGIGKIFLVDPDRVEESNRNRLPLCPSAIGEYKVQAIADYITAIRPDCITIPITDKLDDKLEAFILGYVRYVVECTDSPKNQISLFNKSSKYDGVKFIRAGYDGTHMTVTSTVSGWIKTDVEEETYTIAPSWVVPSVVVAAMAVAKMVKYPNQEVSLDLSEIGIPRITKKSRLTPYCANYKGESIDTGWKGENK